MNTGNDSPFVIFISGGGCWIDTPGPALVKSFEEPSPLNVGKLQANAAEIKITNPGHPVMNSPNKISKKDFDGWVQERGLYFPDEWSEEFEAVLSGHDPGEEPLEGGLLVAAYGKGYFIYTGYSWFRELPAGVPGAYRIFANLISLGK